MEDKTLQKTKNEPLVSFRSADILNGENTVIYGLDMEVFPGDFVYIVGKVGTGKTSIIRTMIGENPLQKGFGQVCGHRLVGIKDKEIFKKLEGSEIWEFRALHGGNCYRLLSFWDTRTETLIVATHGMVKKSQKTPKREIAKAESIRKRYFDDNK